MWSVAAQVHWIILDVPLGFMALSFRGPGPSNARRPVDHSSGYPDACDQNAAFAVRGIAVACHGVRMRPDGLLADATIKDETLDAAAAADLLARRLPTAAHLSARDEDRTRKVAPVPRGPLPSRAALGGLSRRLGDYRLIRVLGEGGMGIVYLGEHVDNGNQVAVKLIHPHLALDPIAMARFTREADVGTRLSHPGIAQTLDRGVLADGRPYFVMPLLRGRTLRDKLRKQLRVPWQEACAFILELVEPLAMAHRQGIVHRDLKPENIMLERDGGEERVRILDFGVMFSFLGGQQPNASRLTRVGAVVGTVGYLPPEQVVGALAGPPADVYALGIMLWEMITGERPYPDLDAFILAQRQLHGDIPSLRVEGGHTEVPLALDRLVRRMMSARPEERPRDAAAVRGALLGLDGAGPTERASVLHESEVRAALAAQGGNPVGDGPRLRPRAALAMPMTAIGTVALIAYSLIVRVAVLAALVSMGRSLRPVLSSLLGAE